MKSKYNVSDTEKEILEKLWEYPMGIKQVALLDVFLREGKEWKRQTLNTHLSRLEEKGLVKRKKRIVFAVYGQTEYNNLLMKESIDYMYDGKISNFVVAFMSEKQITEADLRELQALLERYTKN